MQKLAPSDARKQATVIAEPASVNLFLHLRKPD
jgi:hypothetical protein